MCAYIIHTCIYIITYTYAQTYTLIRTYIHTYSHNTLTNFTVQFLEKLIVHKLVKESYFYETILLTTALIQLATGHYHEPAEYSLHLNIPFL